MPGTDARSFGDGTCKRTRDQSQSVAASRGQIFSGTRGFGGDESGMGKGAIKIEEVSAGLGGDGEE